MRTITKIYPRILLSAVLALATAGAMAAGSGPRDPYYVPPGGKLILNRTESRMDKAAICRHEAAYRHQGRDFIRRCETS